MPTEVVDRRRTQRRTPACTEALCRVRLRAGRELSVINVSPSGALVEGVTRLLPGTHIDVHVTAAQGRVLVRARVTRCAVWCVAADAVVYRGALSFSTDVELPPITVALEPVEDLLTDQRTVASLRPALLLPLRDGDRRDTVADEVGEGPRL